MQRLAHLGQVGLADLLPGLRRLESPARAIRVEGGGDAVLDNDLLERTHHRLYCLSLPELRVEQTRAGIVHDLDQRLPFLTRQLQPLVRPTVQVHHLAEGLLALSPPSMPAPAAPLLPQPRPLQDLLHAAV